MTNNGAIILLKIISKHEKEEKHIKFFIKHLDKEDLEPEIGVENGIIDALSSIGMFEEAY